MYNILRTIRLWLIPSGSLRERIYTIPFIVYQLVRTYGLQELLNQARGQRPSLPSGRAAFSRQGLVNTYDTLRSYWVRGISGIMLVQTAYSYQEWMQRNEPDEKQLDQQRRQQEIFAYRPLISILTPVYNPGIDVLRDTINAVLNQTYTHWEFCLANASSNPVVNQVLEQFARQDQRIRVLHLEENLGIAENSNRALALAQGEYVALLDHDDLLAPDMMYQVVAALNQDHTIDIVYFDEDKVSEDGQTRLEPWFKPGQWSPDLLLSTNYLMHSVLRRDLVVKAGGFDPEMDGAQDWDLSLRLAEHAPKLHHIPRVFYHWRQVEGSAARDANAKPWAYAAQERCIKAHLRRLGVTDAQITFPRLGTVRIVWPPQQAKVSIIIPTKNNLSLLRACLDSIFSKTTYPDYEILVVDNQSDDPAMETYYESLAQNERVRVLRYPHPFNYQTINNWAARQSAGDVLVFLNNDTEVIEPTWLEELVGWAMRPEVGVVGTKLKRPNGKIQHAGMIVGLMGHASHIFEECDDHVYTPFGSIDWYRNYLSVTGACMAVRRTVFDEVDGLDEAYIVGYGDIDFCLRVVAAGYRVVYTPFAVMLHHEGGTRGLSLPPSDVLRASVKMYNLVKAGDGFFNPNLSYASRQPAIAPAQNEDRGERLGRIMREFDLIGVGMSTADWHKIHRAIPDHFLAMKGQKAIRQSSEGLRILVVSHELTRSGAPLILCKLAQYLKRQNHDVEAVCSVDGDLRQEYANSQIPVTIAPHLLQDARAAIPFLANVDVVICNTILTWRVIYSARAFDRPAIWLIHETEFGADLANKQPKIAEALRYATQVIFPTQKTADLYRHFFPDPDHIRSMLTGFAVDRSNLPTQEIIRKKPDELHVISLATIEKRKGQDILLDAAAAMPKDVARKVHFHLVGRTHIDRLFYLKIAWRALWRRNIHLVGELPSEQALRYLDQADIFILTSRDEALPLSIIEAMAFGKPIISTNVGGVVEIIRSGENGYVVDVGDAETIAGLITRLYHEPALRRQLGQQALQDLEIVTTYSEQMAQLVATVYQQSLPHA
jgi:O-antigen biosynthesis protein